MWWWWLRRFVCWWTSGGGWFVKVHNRRQFHRVFLYAKINLLATQPRLFGSPPVFLDFADEYELEQVRICTVLFQDIVEWSDAQSIVVRRHSDSGGKTVKRKERWKKKGRVSCWCCYFRFIWYYHKVSNQQRNERTVPPPSQRPPEERKSLPPASPGRFTCLVSSAISASSPHPHRILVLPATVYILHPYI